MNAQQAYKTLNVNSESSFNDIKHSYRKLALELHPDKNLKEPDGIKFKKVTEAYHVLKKQHKRKNMQNSASSKPKQKYQNTKTKQQHDFTRKKQQWGKTPEEDWGKFTREFEQENPNFWKEYEKKFWQEYDAHIKGNSHGEEFEKTKEPKEQPNLNVDVDASLCIGCCSCEMIAPDVFAINKNSKMNPKSQVINPKGAGVNKIMNAAETCPTKAIRVENKDTSKVLFPW